MRRRRDPGKELLILRAGLADLLSAQSSLLSAQLWARQQGYSPALHILELAEVQMATAQRFLEIVGPVGEGPHSHRVEAR